MKTLRELLIGGDVLKVHGDVNIPVSGIAYNSQHVRPGFCFMAIKGFVCDGLEFVPDAVRRGARAVVSMHPPLPELANVAWVQVKNDRHALSHLAARFYDNPSQRLTVVGVTGTNGKTTTVHLIADLLNRESKTARIGTLGMDFSGLAQPVSLTTPEAPELFQFMAQVEAAGGVNLVMEVSSSSLSLHRVTDINFSQAVFTSFSGDHLDFHGSMERYFQAKLSLFKKLSPENWAVINVDDPMAPALIGELNCQYLTFGFSPQADIRPLKYKLTLPGINAQLQTPKGKLEFDCPLAGRFNLANIMAAVGSALVKGVSGEQIAAALKSFQPVKGRVNVAYAGDFQVIVDYAHTDDALKNLLQSLKEIISGRIILVFGAGGCRDKTKRPRMGQVASQLADVVAVTSDNPRQEEPQAIIQDVVAGMEPGFKAVQIEADRRQAIGRAIDLAKKGDLVVIAGKGHEDYQIFKDRRIHFDDFEVVREKMRGRNA